MASARNKALRRFSVRRGCPLPTGEGVWGGPTLQKFILIFELKMANFCAFWEVILLQLNCLSYTHKPVSLDFGL